MKEATELKTCALLARGLRALLQWSRGTRSGNIDGLEELLDGLEVLDGLEMLDGLEGLECLEMRNGSKVLSGFKVVRSLDVLGGSGALDGIDLRSGLSRGNILSTIFEL